ncbi:MAG: glycosyltransferase family 2 protein [Candidatus Rokubacteria bacterium]|nr:glycosyltransferase family 2 protein [Candidatus Rokubacteria bacterium]
MLNPSEGAGSACRKKLSVVIPTFNVEGIIGRCLDALRWADEVNVVDMHSTDGTRAICETYPNVRFYENRGYIYANVNFGVERASYGWVMRLDSDEVVTPELASEIQDVVLTEAHPEYAGFYVPSRVFFFGRWIKYGPAHDPRSPVPGEAYRRLIFRRGTAYYRCEREHEDLTTTGAWGFLRSHYLHYSHESISQWIAKMNYYTDRDVERVDPADIVPRTFYVPRLLYWLTRNFYGLYVARRGYRDGFHGFVVCLLHAWYPIVEELKRWEKKWNWERRAVT